MCVNACVGGRCRKVFTKLNGIVYKIGGIGMKQKHVKLYNVIFPIWLLVAFPITWLIVIPANIIFDSLVICLSMKKYKVQDIKEKYKKVIVKVVCFGFLADIIGGAFMLVSQYIPFSKFMEDTTWIYHNFVNPVMYNPLDSILSLLWVLAAMTISSVLIYFWNYKYSFKNMEEDPVIRKKLSLILAVVTTPILFLIPTAWFW